VGVGSRQPLTVATVAPGVPAEPGNARSTVT